MGKRIQAIILALTITITTQITTIPSYAEENAGRTIHFTVDVNCSNYDSSVEDKIYKDYGVIMLPETYTTSGTPTRLVIWCHGGGDNVSAEDSQLEETLFAKLLLANGYACMDVNGLPEEYAKLKDLDINNSIGSPMCVECYEKAYEYARKEFNIYDEVIIGGASMGGLTSSNIVINGDIPIIAQVAACPVNDTYNHVFLHPWAYGAPKRALITFYGLTVFDEETAKFISSKGFRTYVYDENKIGSYNPNNWSATHKYPVPTLFVHSVDDQVVSIDRTRIFVQNIVNNNGIGYLYELPGGGHGPDSFSNNGKYRIVSNPYWETLYQGSDITIYPAVDVMMNWIESFESGNFKTTLIKEDEKFYVEKSDKYLNINKLFDDNMMITGIDFAGLDIASHTRIIDISSLSPGEYSMNLTVSENGEAKDVEKTIVINDSQATLPQAARIKSLVSGKGKLEVFATTAPSKQNADYYQIFYRQKGSSIWHKASTKSSSKVLSKLKKSKRYYVKIRACKSVGGTVYYGDWSKAKLSNKIK